MVEVGPAGFEPATDRL